MKTTSPSADIHGEISVAKLDNMTNGWFVGDFYPTVYKTDAVEVGVKHYKAGDSENSHFHKIATEITLVVSGKVEMDGKIYSTGDIITVPKRVHTNFKALEDTTTTVVKLPGAKGDKYYSVDL